MVKTKISLINDVKKTRGVETAEMPIETEKKKSDKMTGLSIALFHLKRIQTRTEK